MITPKFYTYGHTINFPTRMKIKHFGKWVDWSSLTPKQQHRFFIIKYLPNVINNLYDKCIFYFELTALGNLHAHGTAGVVKRDDISNLEQYWLVTARRAVIQAHDKSRLSRDFRRTQYSDKRMHYIHSLKDIPDWEKYIRKDINVIPLQPYLYTSIALSLQ